MNDDELFQKLRSSRPSCAFPSDFQREIWGRIEAEEGLTFSASVVERWRSLLGWIAHPVQAIALAVVMGAIGCLLATGSKRGQNQPAEMMYIKSVSPFAAAKITSR